MKVLVPHQFEKVFLMHIYTGIASSVRIWGCQLWYTATYNLLLILLLILLLLILLLLFLLLLSGSGSFEIKWNIRWMHISVKNKNILYVTIHSHVMYKLRIVFSKQTTSIGTNSVWDGIVLRSTKSPFVNIIIIVVVGFRSCNK